MAREARRPLDIGLARRRISIRPQPAPSGRPGNLIAYGGVIEEMIRRVTRKGLVLAITTAIAGAGCSAASGTPSQPTTDPVSISSSVSPSPSAVPEPSFHGGIQTIGPTLRRELIGRNWHPGCPVPIEDLRVVTVDYWNFDGVVRSGPLVVNASVAADVRWVFGQLFDARFRISKIALPARYRPHHPIDWLATGDVTAAFNCRPVTGDPGVLSQHAYGLAIDINPLENPYVRGDGTVLRRAAAPFRDRSRNKRGMIHPGDVVVRSFAAIGWGWGGDWHSLKDYMHFSSTGT